VPSRARCGRAEPGLEVREAVEAAPEVGGVTPELWVHTTARPAAGSLGHWDP